MGFDKNDIDNKIIMEKEFISQVKEGDRFEFGKNWKSFLNTLDEQRIKVACDSLCAMLDTTSLEGKTFLDIGCGSGLFSLAAKKLNAKEVYSIDFDPESVNCTTFLRDKFYKDDKSWKVEKQSVLDSTFMKSLAKYDIVYSWGVLHHTGNMELALDNANYPVAQDGKLFIALYNDEGHLSRRWLKLKQLYNAGPISYFIVKWWYYCRQFIRYLISDLRRFKNPRKRYTEYQQKRGMSMVHDWKDWIGGLPFEVASPEYIIKFFQKRNFQISNLRTTNGSGCNEFVFIKNSNS